jgi:hypothetical protein
MRICDVNTPATEYYIYTTVSTTQYLTLVEQRVPPV